jgi:hypothetical protein
MGMKIRRSREQTAMYLILPEALPDCGNQIHGGRAISARI